MDPGSEDAEEGSEAGADAELRELFVKEGQHGLRLDRVLVELNPEFSRSYLQQLVAAGAVALNGQSTLKVAMRGLALRRISTAVDWPGVTWAFTPPAS